jgi:hypothetical protein
MWPFFKLTCCTYINGALPVWVTQLNPILPVMAAEVVSPHAICMTGLGKR